MDKNETDAPLIGDNSGEFPLPSVDDVVAKLEADNAAALARTTELLEKGQQYLVITNDVEDSAATQFMVSLRARYKQSEADRVAAVTPWDDRRGAAHAFFKTKILDLLGLGPSKAEEAFDPVACEQYGMGPRINRAQTIYKLKKVEDERKAREAEAKRLRDIEIAENAKRAAAEKAKRDEEDRLRREAQAAADKARKEADAAAAAARKEAEEAAAAASRKRNEESKATAEAEAAAARKRADEAAAAARKQAEEDAAARKVEDDRIAQERAERDEANRLEENRLAEERAQAEESASVSLADLSRSRGDKGGVAALRQFTNWRDVNRETLDYAALGPYFKDAHIETAIKAYADANKATVHTGIKTGNQPIKGIIFFLDAKNGGRA